MTLFGLSRLCMGMFLLCGTVNAMDVPNLKAENILEKEQWVKSAKAIPPFHGKINPEKKERYTISYYTLKQTLDVIKDVDLPGYVPSDEALTSFLVAHRLAAEITNNPHAKILMHNVFPDKNLSRVIDDGQQTNVSYNKASNQFVGIQGKGESATFIHVDLSAIIDTYWKLMAKANTGAEKPQPPMTKSGKQADMPEPSMANLPASLANFLTTFSIPPKVLEIAMIGVQNYHKGSQLQRLYTIAMSDDDRGTGGFRDVRLWIDYTFGQSEKKLLRYFADLSAPPTWTVDEINQLYAKKDGTPVSVTLVKKVSANFWHMSPYGKNALVQLASQYNYLEAPSDEIVPVSVYLGDYTQGPQASIEAAAAAIYRRAVVEADRLPNALSEVLPPDARYYKNGYLKLFAANANELSALHDRLQETIGKLKVLPQWVINEASGVAQVQVFTAAPSFQGANKPAEGSIEEKICTLLVSTQYEAIAKLAAIKSAAEPNDVVNLHLTLVGQGVFKNPESVMYSSMAKVVEVLKGYPNVHVYVHGYSEADQRLIRKVFVEHKGDVDLKEMDRAAFIPGQQ